MSATSYEAVKVLCASLLLAMGCYYSRVKWCAPALMGDGGEGEAGEAGDVDGVDDETRVAASRDVSPRAAHDSASRASRGAEAPSNATSGCGRGRVQFREPLCEHHGIALLRDIPLWVREEMYWQARDYANIRENQRRLIDVVLRQARDCPDGRVPPPIPGESRRGLGICCEPGTNSGRAARVRSARRAIVEAQRDGRGGKKQGDSTSLQRECAHASPERNAWHAWSSPREMIARPKMSQNERKTTEIRPF